MNSTSYTKRPLWQWILFYLILGGIIYTVLYFALFQPKTYQRKTQMQSQVYQEPMYQLNTNHIDTPKDLNANPTATEDKPLDQIAKDVMITYLERYKRDTTEDTERITNYEIEQIDQVHIKDQELRFRVSYSIKTPQSDVLSNWQAGNGILTQDGWIRHKVNFIIATKQNNTYTLKSMATGVFSDF